MSISRDSKDFEWPTEGARNETSIMSVSWMVFKHLICHVEASTTQHHAASGFDRDPAATLPTKAEARRASIMSISRDPTVVKRPLPTQRAS